MAGKVLVMGIGNVLRGDDAAGIDVVRRLAKKQIPGLTVLEHPGDGADMLASWHGWEHVIVVDAMKSGATPGRILRFRIPEDKLPVRCFQTGSTHAFGLGEAIEIGLRIGNLPHHLVVFGIEGEQFWLGSRFSGTVSSQLGTLASMIVVEVNGILKSWPVEPPGGKSISSHLTS